MPETTTHTPAQKMLPDGKRPTPALAAENIVPISEKSPVFDPLRPYKSAFWRSLEVYRHVLGLFGGGLLAYLAALPPLQRRGLKNGGKRLLALFIRPFILKELRRATFPVQLRRRLELLGPTYVKLGQVLSLREDLLPSTITTELKNLLDRLPEVPFPAIRNIIETDLRGRLEDLFLSVDEKPIGSASIAQTHLATLPDGNQVVLKIIKPGIRESILSDIILLRWLGGLLQKVIPQYQPKNTIEEFCSYTEREVDTTAEADNAEIFAANFKDEPDIVFPKIFRKYCGENVLCMEFLRGVKPGAESAANMTPLERDRVIELGAKSIIRMLYLDGFFHADLHPGNLLILPGGRVAFIDLGMVGRFEDRVRRKMLYYFYALVNGDVDGAAEYLTAMAKVGAGGDPNGFRRACADAMRRFYMHAARGEYSLGKMILDSVGLGAQYRIFFPVEMTLMVKALVTFEGVGLLMNPDLDVPKISQKYVTEIFNRQFSVSSLYRDFMRNSPELVDTLVRLPKILSDVLRFAEETVNDRTPSNPLAGLRSGIIAGACIVGGVISVVQGGPTGLWVTLFGLGILFSMFGK
jgi:ubiquinone biosynthesis protein